MTNLVKKAKYGDKDAFSQLIRLNEPGMFKIAVSILCNKDDALDAIQDAILICWEKIESLKQDRYFRTWLVRILINCCYAILRKQTAGSDIENIPEQGAESTAFGFAEWLECIKKLPDERYRAVLVLYYAQEFKVKEIAEIMGANPNTVKDWLVKARKQYQELIVEAGYEKI